MNSPNRSITETALILAAHGSSKDERINQPMFQLARQIEQQSDFSTVTAAFLDGHPDIRTIINDIAEDEVVVIPFMASAGFYTDVVFPKAMVCPAKTVRFTDPIGLHPVIPHLVSTRINSITSRFPEAMEATVIVVGHGTRRNKNSCRSTIDLVQHLRKSFENRQIEFAFIDQNPDIEHVAGKLLDGNLLIIPFLMGLGPHVTLDIPLAFGLKEIERAVFGSEFQFPLLESRTSSSGQSSTVLFDAPVGIYEQWVVICIELAQTAANEQRDLAVRRTFATEAAP